MGSAQNHHHRVKVFCFARVLISDSCLQFECNFMFIHRSSRHTTHRSKSMLRVCNRCLTFVFECEFQCYVCSRFICNTSWSGSSLSCCTNLKKKNWLKKSTHLHALIRLLAYGSKSRFYTRAYVRENVYTRSAFRLLCISYNATYLLVVCLYRVACGCWLTNGIVIADGRPRFIHLSMN